MKSVDQMGEEAFGAVFAKNCIDPERLQHFAALVAERCAEAVRTKSLPHFDSRPTREDLAELILAEFPKP